jgi:hypothetical protein
MRCSLWIWNKDGGSRLLESGLTLGTGVLLMVLVAAGQWHVVQSVTLRLTTALVVG